MVIVEHFCETGMFGAFKLSSTFSNQFFLHTIYSFSREAVDVFIILSGYFLINSERQKIGKVINLVAMTIFYSVLLYLLSCIMGQNELSIKKFCIRIVPQNYFLFLYVSLYLMSPYLNRIVCGLSKKGYLCFLFVLLFLFSIWPTFINLVQSILNIKMIGVYTLGLSGSDMGFNIMTFILLYYIGGAIRKYTDNISMKSSLAVYIFITFGLLLIAVSCKSVSKVFYYYDSFFLIIQAISLSIIFKNVHLEKSSILTFLAEKTYGVFLVHFFILNFFDYVFDIKKELVNASFCYSAVLSLLVIFIVYIASILFVSLINLISSIISKKWKNSNLYNRNIFVG
jgi:surface polysaccharide O-acyltransferase-like enzyme